MMYLEQVWHDMLNRIYKTGLDCTKDDANIRECLGIYKRIRNPLLDKGFAFSHPSRTFVSWMKEGAFDIDGYPMKGQALVDYVTSLDDEGKICLEKSEDSFVYTYPERLKRLLTVIGIDAAEFHAGYVNQIDVICDRLMENIGTNRAVACLYQPGMDGARMDIPCLNWLQVIVRNNTMVLNVMFRSNDIYGAWPSNMYFLTYLGLQIQERLNVNYPTLTFSYIDYHVSSAHIYETDFDAVEKVLKEV